MKLDKNKDNFFYSQSAISTFLKCPIKFKFKYLDDLFVDLGAKKSYFSFGKDFHLLAERWFKGISSGDEYLDKESDLYKYFQKMKKRFPIDGNKKYYVEKLIKDRDKKNILSVYDLVIIGKNNIEIWDWKTNKEKLDEDIYKNSMQTRLYLYLIYKNIDKLLGYKVGVEKISMNYWQANYEDDSIRVDYTLEAYLDDEIYINELIEEIEGFDFEKSKRVKVSECKWCDYIKICQKR